MRCATRTSFTDANGNYVCTTIYADSPKELKEKVGKVFSGHSEPLSNLSVMLVPPLSISAFWWVSFLLLLGAASFFCVAVGRALFLLATHPGQSAFPLLVMATFGLACALVLSATAQIDFRLWRSGSGSEKIERELAELSRK